MAKQAQSNQAQKQANKRKDDDDQHDDDQHDQKEYNDGDDSNDDENDDDEIIDLSTADANTVIKREIVPKGSYACTVSKVTYKKFKSGNGGLVILLEVSEGKYAKSDTRKRAKTFISYVTATKENVDILATNLKALGVEKSVYKSKTFSTKTLVHLADSGDLIGNPVIVEVVVGEYNGEKQNNVRGLRHPSSVDNDRLPSDKSYIED
jgi:hypothetical protein